MDRTYKLLIDGELVDGVARFDVINPATATPFATCPKADEQLLDRAVAAARSAFPAWSRRPVQERAELVEALAAAITDRGEELASLLTAEQGKPLGQARIEVANCARALRAFRDMRLEPKVLRESGTGRVVEYYTALGVVAAIVPWNFPLVLLIQKLAPALIAGCTMVAKPAPTTPLTALLLGEISRGILPAGVFNVICDENDLGVALTSHPDVAKIAFTGSTATGRKVMASAAGTVKRVTLELGGNDAAIVLDDVDPLLAAENVFRTAMFNAGQICVAAKRAYVPSAMYDAFCDRIAELAGTAVVDDGANQGAQIGPVQNRMQYDKVLALIADARTRGTIIAGGEPLDRDGYFIPPTIVRDLPDDAPLVREEQFGPVLPVLRYDDIDDVIARANASEFGLGGTVWGSDVERAIDVAGRIETGTVWVNQPMAIDPNIPLRGSKQSGLGGELGEAGLREYAQAHIINASLAIEPPAR